MKNFQLLVIPFFLYACQLNQEKQTDNNTSTAVGQLTDSKVPTPDYLTYPWLSSQSNDHTMMNRIPTPTGWQRVPVAKGSFAEWLRYLPLHEAGHAVKLFNGALKNYQGAHHAVVKVGS